ncbi:bile acid:sodium symporter [Pirellulimonas nuda]|uniref:bile acid:sodium symporter n=1 Tax=Pirellulimonas nuda TaxID=2528009 RepID=UPI0018D3277F|nr:bile acid:sodium symporter [Pirellulimonas nuda]
MGAPYLLGTLRRQWFLITLAILLLGAFLAPARLAPITEQTPTGWVVAAVMLLTALGVNLRAAASHRGTWVAALLAIAVSTLAAPPLGWLSGRVLPRELAIGMIVAASVPCTLASAAVWTRRGGGNEAAALLVSIATNLLCFLVLPFWTTLLAGAAAEANFAALAWKLLGWVVAPIVVSQAARCVPAVSRWCDRRRTTLGMAAQCGVLFMVLVGAVEASLKTRSVGGSVRPADWLLMILMVAAVHIALAVLGWFAAGWAGLARGDRLATAIAGSQKTLAVGVLVALPYGGLAVLPMIAYHVFQLVIDTVWVDRERRRA